MWCMYVYIHICTGTSAMCPLVHTQSEEAIGILPCSSLPYSLETGPFTEPGTHLVLAGLADKPSL